MMIDFAVRRQAAGDGAWAEAAMYRACLLRFRPTMMTTIVGALSQLATLFITPVIYVHLENLRRMLREHAVAVPAAPLHEPNAPVVGD